MFRMTIFSKLFPSSILSSAPLVKYPEHLNTVRIDTLFRALHSTVFANFSRNVSLTFLSRIIFSESTWPILVYYKGAYGSYTQLTTSLSK